ncbi:alpha/beta fold hydrolase [Streptomyces niger]|uniref:alpha/beta fold hydrolase n=1 Tax=Streptomyces niger TaxID=66373 RepID=UPI00069C3CB9|nr:alpha/beta hydrolase [Streptomyces niger]
MEAPSAHTGRPIFDDLVTARLRTAVHRPMSEDTRQAVAILDTVTAPTLVLWGAEDTWLPTTTGDRLATAIPGAVRATLPGAGHFIAEDRPEDTAKVLVEFFGSRTP